MQYYHILYHYTHYIIISYGDRRDAVAARKTTTDPKDQII